MGFAIVTKDAVEYLECEIYPYSLSFNFFKEADTLKVMLEWTDPVFNA